MKGIALAVLAGFFCLAIGGGFSTTDASSPPAIVLDGSGADDLPDAHHAYPGRLPLIEKTAAACQHHTASFREWDAIIARAQGPPVACI